MKKKVRIFVITEIIMLLVAISALLVLSTLVYFLKWQSDKAMAGIVVAYVLSGFFGGLSYSWMSKKQENGRMGIAKKTAEAVWLSLCFFMMLIFCSLFLKQNILEISVRMLLIGTLFLSSCFLGRIL